MGILNGIVRNCLERPSPRDFLLEHPHRVGVRIHKEGKWWPHSFVTHVEPLVHPLDQVLARLEVEEHRLINRGETNGSQERPDLDEELALLPLHALV